MFEKANIMTDTVPKLKIFLQEIANEMGSINGNIDIQAISSGGANYTSDLFLVTISAPKKRT